MTPRGTIPELHDGFFTQLPSKQGIRHTTSVKIARERYKCFLVHKHAGCFVATLDWPDGKLHVITLSWPRYPGPFHGGSEPHKLPNGFFHLASSLFDRPGRQARKRREMTTKCEGMVARWSWWSFDKQTTGHPPSSPSSLTEGSFDHKSEKATIKLYTVHS